MLTGPVYTAIYVAARFQYVSKWLDVYLFSKTEDKLSFVNGNTCIFYEYICEELNSYIMLGNNFAQQNM